MASSSWAAPRELRVSVPTVSQLGDSGNTPSSGSRPGVGLSPTMPQ